MSDAKPQPGEIVTVIIPQQSRRRKWCELCSQWTWEAGKTGSNIWRHGRGRTKECRKEARDAP